MSTVPPVEWKWFGNAAHFICGHNCRFHLTTLIGHYLVSTVGEYLPDESVREIMARSRGIQIEGRGDARRADFMKKIGYEEIGCDRKYETMVFKAGAPCSVKECGCGLPSIDGSELDFAPYNQAGDATTGHLEMCRQWAEYAAPKGDPSMKHGGYTPGPWTANLESDHGDYTVWGPAPDDAFLANIGTAPAEDRVVAFDVAEANARLIAEAPYLAERVEELENLLELIQAETDAPVARSLSVGLCGRIYDVLAEAKP